eukprot:TRINITY_DN8742_c0_g5_i1.p1 TRINITY_DN8742_c0_g5~~TRINITY_DN8742_c0_g5_i1.p1  ORF type:complete len:195 (-),score=50.20 TRINITY_DN8742_c0_g5_i1:125-709(-)
MNGAQRAINKGYMAIVTKLSNLLLDAAGKSLEMVEYLATVEGWREYESETLRRINAHEETKLGTSKREGCLEDNILYLLYAYHSGELENSKEKANNEEDFGDLKLDLKSEGLYDKDFSKDLLDDFQDDLERRNSFGAADVESVRVLLDEVIKCDEVEVVRAEDVAANVINSYADNNYWRSDAEYTIEDIEFEYS